MRYRLAYAPWTSQSAVRLHHPGARRLAVEETTAMVDQPAVAWVEQHTHPSDKVTLIERWVPAKPGEYAPCLFRQAGTDHYIPMRLESRRIVETPSYKGL